MPASVLLITNEYPPEKTAGTAMSTQFLAEELAARGNRVLVVVNTRRKAPGREANGNLDVLRLRPVGLPKTRMAQRAVLLANIALRARPDIIQGQSLSCGFLALLVGRCLGIPATTYVQGYDLYDAGPWARRTFVRWALTHSDCVAAVTGDLRAKAYNLSGRWAEVIPHGLRMRDAHRLDRQAARALLHLPMDARLVLFVGRLISLKGLQYLIRAMTRVVNRCPDARLVIVGEGQEHRHLAELTSQLALEGYVTFQGGLAHEDVIRFMRAADVFVLPSLTEPFGIVLVEAMSCGLPLVASNVMGIPSIVEEGINGFLVPPGDERALADRITQLLTDPAEAAAIGRRNIEMAQRYAIPHIADLFLKLWEQSITARRDS